jgi:hypothetical protein
MSGGSYIIPIDARSTVVARSSSDHENPTRGAKLFLSMVKSCERIRRERPRRRHVEQIVTDAVKQLHPRVQLPVVLNEEPVEGRVVRRRQVAKVLLQRRVAERRQAVARTQIGGIGRECIGEALAADAIVGDELRIDAGLEPVFPADPGQVLDDLPDTLVEVEAHRRAIADAGAAEVGHASDRGRRTVDRRVGQRAELVTTGVTAQPLSLSAPIVDTSCADAESIRSVKSVARSSVLRPPPMLDGEKFLNRKYRADSRFEALIW